MRKPTLLDDFREVKENWHDLEFRRGFLGAFWPNAIWSFLKCGLIGFLVAYGLSHLLE